MLCVAQVQTEDNDDNIMEKNIKINVNKLLFR